MGDLAAHHDVPLCPENGCKGPLVTRAEHHRSGEYPPEDTLVCLACGTGRAGSPEQVAQAERARDAWQKFQEATS